MAKKPTKKKEFIAKQLTRLNDITWAHAKYSKTDTFIDCMGCSQVATSIIRAAIKFGERNAK